MFAKKSRIAFVRHSEILSQKVVVLGRGFCCIHKSPPFLCVTLTLIELVGCHQCFLCCRKNWETVEEHKSRHHSELGLHFLSLTPMGCDAEMSEPTPESGKPCHSN